MSGGVMMHRLFRNFLQRRLSEVDPERYVSLARAPMAQAAQSGQFKRSTITWRQAASMKRLEIVRRTTMRTISRATWKHCSAGARRSANMRSGSHFLHTCALILTDRYLYTDAIAELDLAGAGFAAMDEPGWVAEARLQRDDPYLARRIRRSARAGRTRLGQYAA
ncbi:MAG: hypothetical protein HND48_15865 [Chloroflexi bacterium]|nr:hypothetical protein [Chloroflexota bacterium]